jgi:NADH-quinone oxidoreductase subunit H
MKFALFFLAEYVNMVTVSALAATLFLGGWRAPWPLSLWSGANDGWWPMLWFTGKVILLIFVFVWLRGTLPRLRYDQFMHLGWKVLLPINLGWILVVATIRVLDDRGWSKVGAFAVALAPVLIIFAIASFALDRADRRRAVAETAADQAEEQRTKAFPVPPMDLVVPPLPRMATTATGRPGITVGSEGGDS